MCCHIGNEISALVVILTEFCFNGASTNVCNIFFANAQSGELAECLAIGVC